MGNMFLYPVPKPSYKASTSDPTLLYVPQTIEKTFFGSFMCSKNRIESTKIPCRYIPHQNSSSPSPYLMIFFHGNSEDIGFHLSEILLQFSERFSMDILCPEYPTYGIYREKDDSLTMDEAMLQDARTVITYCHKQLRYKYENIILVGRSLGCGLAVRLASEFDVKGMVLISAYTSVRDIARNMVGSIMARFVPDAFRNVDYMDKIRCPALFIHGEDDSLIPMQMAIELHAKTRKGKMLRINRGMTHNQFRIESDLFTPIHMFMIGNLDLRTHLFPKVKKSEKKVGCRENSEKSEKKSEGSSKLEDTEASNS